MESQATRLTRCPASRWDQLGASQKENRGQTFFARINLKGDELDMYYKVHEALAEKIPKPDLMVYLRADTDVLMQRIALRDRSYERNMEREYIDQLNRTYEDFFNKPYDNIPVLKIDTNPLNIIQNVEHLKMIENRIRETLRVSPFQPGLPLTEKLSD